MSYSNYSTYLKFKNCCRPIGDTGPPGTAGPTGPAGPTIRGNKGEILYFSETDTLDSTNTIFITNGNVRINNNLLVTGNLSMDDNFINDVSGIYFSDGTYIGDGSSFDIKTKQLLDINAIGGISVTGNLTVNDAATFKSDTTINANLTINGATTIRSTLDVSGNLSMNKNSIKDVDTIYFSENGSSNQIFIDYAFNNFIIKSQGSIKFTSEDITNANVNSDIDIAILNNNNLRFNNDNTYITSNIADDKLSLYGNSIFMEAGVNGDFTFTGNSNNVDLNFLTLNATGFTINYNDSDDKIRFNIDDLVIDKSNNYTGIQTDTPSATLEVNGNVIISGNLSMNDNFIHDVSGIYFTQGNLLFSDFSSSIQQVQLPSSQGQPISLERKTLFYDDNFNINTGGSPIDISFVVPNFNQLGLTISGSGNTIISPSSDISGQYIEIYANFLVNSTNGSSKTIALDISGVSSGSSFIETIDVRTISKKGTYYITFGPHIFAPEQWADTSDFVITANTTSTFTIEQYKLMFKSYFM